MACGSLRAGFSHRGAELRQLFFHGKPVLFHGNFDPWPHPSAVLFPVIGQPPSDWKVPAHGYARNEIFDLVDASSEEVVFRLEHVPQGFGNHQVLTIEISHRLTNEMLKTAVVIENTGHADARFGFGFHPVFQLPRNALAKAGNVTLETIACLPQEAVLMQQMKQTEKTIQLIAEGNTLAIEPENFQKGGLLLKNTSSEELILRAHRMRWPVAVRSGSARHLALWSLPGMDIFSVEPWVTLPAGRSGGFETGKQFLELQAGARRRFEMAIIVLPVTSGRPS
ncbi:hypothetical protein [Roseibium sp.]|uniref:aldose epimerase family protein n=1 Tax=Roseibium sp. TaxID=1936156 RepID=UPI00345BADFB